MIVQWQVNKWMPVVALSALALAIPGTPPVAEESGGNWTDARQKVASAEGRALTGELWVNSVGVAIANEEVMVNPELKVSSRIEPAIYEADTSGFGVVRTADDGEPIEPYTAPAGPDAEETMDEPEEGDLYEFEAIEEEDEDSGSVLSDAWITTKVKSSLIFTRDVPGVFIGVQTKDGVVELSGTVKSHEQKALAIETAEGIKGVLMVVSDDLLVEPPMEEYQEDYREDLVVEEFPEDPFTEEYPANLFADEYPEDPAEDEGHEEYSGEEYEE